MERTALLGRIVLQRGETECEQSARRGWAGRTCGLGMMTRCDASHRGWTLNDTALSSKVTSRLTVVIGEWERCERKRGN